MNSAAWTAAGPGGSAAYDKKVRKTLALVAKKRRAFVRQVSCGTTAPAGGGVTSSFEGIVEGGGEPFESGCKPGIYHSYIGVQPKLTARKGPVCTNFDALGFEPGAGQQLLHRRGWTSPIFLREMMEMLALLQPHHEGRLPRALSRAVGEARFEFQF